MAPGRGRSPPCPQAPQGRGQAPTLASAASDLRVLFMISSRRCGAEGAQVRTWAAGSAWGAGQDPWQGQPLPCPAPWMPPALTFFLSSRSCSSRWKCFSRSRRCRSASSRALASASSLCGTARMCGTGQGCVAQGRDSGNRLLRRLDTAWPHTPPPGTLGLAAPHPCILLRWEPQESVPAFPLHPCLHPHPTSSSRHHLHPRPVFAAAPSPPARPVLSPGLHVPPAADVPPPAAGPGPPCGSAPPLPPAPAPPAAACGEGTLSKVGARPRGWGREGGQHPPLPLLLLPAFPLLALPLLTGLATLLCQQPGSLLPVRGASWGSAWGGGWHGAGGCRGWWGCGVHAVSVVLPLLPALLPASHPAPTCCWLYGHLRGLREGWSGRTLFLLLPFTHLHLALLLPLLPPGPGPHLGGGVGAAGQGRLVRRAEGWAGGCRTGFGGCRG